VIIVVALLLIFNQHIPFLGRLPGDIFVRKGNFSFYFPIVTFLIVSIVLTIIINLVLRFFK